MADAADFIGSGLCDLLIENGNEAVGVDSYSIGSVDKSGYEVVHLANPRTISIKREDEIACAETVLDSEIIKFEDQDLGWVGDSKTNQLDISTLISKGILPKRNSEQAVIESARRLKIQHEKYKLKND